jgi:PIN domain nuclease of toxin-antitoxin system
LLPVGFGDLARIEKMPCHHRDPFDRMMAAQALERQPTIVSGDPLFEKYGVKRVW